MRIVRGNPDPAWGVASSGCRDATAAEYSSPMEGGESLPALRIRIRWMADGLFLEYSGLPAQLTEAGAATPDMVAPGRRGFRRFDADGDLYNTTRQYNTGRVTVSRWKSPARAAGLPGVREWLASPAGVEAEAPTPVAREIR